MNPPKKIPLHESEHPVLPGSIIAAAPHPHEVVKVYLHLRYPRDSPGLPTVEDYVKQKKRKRKHLSHDEFESLHGADPEDIEKVKTFAKEYGLHVLAIDAAHRMITVTGSVETFNRAFSVWLVHFRHGHSIFRGHHGPVHVPEELAEIVTGVHGLDNRPAAEPRVRSMGTYGYQGSRIAYNPIQLAGIYNFPKALTGAGQSIAVIELGGGYYPQYIASYFRDYLRMPIPKICSIPVDGGYNNPGVSPSDLEVQLDIEILGAAAPGAGIYVYFAPDTSSASFLKAVKQAVHAKELNHSIISISWGMTESTLDRATINAFNQTFQEAAAKRITVLAASGDNGSYNKTYDGLAHVDFPASSPYVLGCGGTTLTARCDKIQDEVVWNEGYSGASGGGVSGVFPIPLYQEMAGLEPRSVNPGNKPGRGVPDVSGDADPKTGYIVSVNGRYQVCGGTSAVAPLWAALVARINERLTGRAGFINPLLYDFVEPGDIFNDITRGNNSIFGIPGYPAKTGWDACTGWGSPNGEKIAGYLVPEIENMEYE